MKAAAILLLTATSAAAHSWYDSFCCSESDCRPVPADQVLEISEGVWKYLPTGNTFYNEGKFRRIRPSKDDRFHVCIGRPHAEPGQGFKLVPGISHCIYVVQGN